MDLVFCARVRLPTNSCTLSHPQPGGIPSRFLVLGPGPGPSRGHPAPIAGVNPMLVCSHLRSLPFAQVQVCGLQHVVLGRPERMTPSHSLGGWRSGTRLPPQHTSLLAAEALSPSGMCGCRPIIRAALPLLFEAFQICGSWKSLSSQPTVT